MVLLMMVSPAEFHPASLSDEQLLSECRVRHTRRGGPGGQHRNKVQTAVVVTHAPTGIEAEASERRSQAQNQSEALFRLRLRLALKVRGAVDATAPASALWRGRAAEGRIRVNPDHADFPSLLAEALDRMESVQWDPTTAAEGLAVSTSQLVRFIKSHPPALEWVNAQRAALGLHRLR